MGNFTGVGENSVRLSRPIAALAASAGLALVSGPGLAQRQAPSPEQRIERLERQLQQVQRQVFPRGRPADSAGFSDEPAATQSSVVTLDQRLNSLERQMSDILRQSEENGNRLRTLESDLAKARSDQDQRLATLEQRINDAAATLLTNYRSNPDGARAQDSLYFLGQALMKLGQPGQACKAYAELESVYGAKVRADLKKQVATAKTDAQCG